MLRGIIDQVQLTFRLLFDKRVPFWAKLVGIAPIIYVISPIDFIPDVILGLGQLDDLGLILAGMRLFETVVPDYIVQEHRQAIGRRNRPLEVVDAPQYRVTHESEQQQ